MNKFWHYAVIVGIVFACIYVYNAGTFKGLPFVGGYVSK